MIRGISAGLDHRRRVEMQIQSFTGIHLPLRLENSLALIVLEKGKLFVELDDNRTMLSAPALLCLHDRRRLRASRQEDAAGSILQFNPTFLNASMTLENLRQPCFEELAERHFLFQLAPFLSGQIDHNILYIDDGTLTQILYCTHSCRRELESRQDGYWSCRARSYLMDILRLIENQYYDYGPHKTGDDGLTRKVSAELRSILEYLDANLEQPPSLDDVCIRFHTYRKKVEDMFHAYLGTTFYGYIKQERLKKVCYYLRFTELRANEIAARVGFSTPQNLAKFFQRETGQSMQLFRRLSVQKRRLDGINMQFREIAEGKIGRDSPG